MWQQLHRNVEHTFALYGTQSNGNDCADNVLVIICGSLRTHMYDHAGQMIVCSVHLLNANIS